MTLLTAVLLLTTHFFTIAVGQDEGSQLLMVQGQELLLLDLETNTTQTVLVSDHAIFAFDYHLEKKLLFWATHSHIFRCPLIASEDAVTHQVAAVGLVGGLAVDWVHDTLYWSDMEAGQIETAKLNGSSRQVIYRLGRPTSVAVDPLIGKLFWVDDEDSRSIKIRSSYLDGSFGSKHLWATAPVLWKADRLNPRSSLTLDVQTQELYFKMEENLQTTVMMMHYRRKRMRVAVNCRSLAGGVAGLGERVYWSNITNVFWTRVGDVHDYVVHDHLKDIKQLKVVSQKLQPAAEDKCKHNTCAQKCLVVDYYPTCTCDYGYSIKDDYSNCAEDGYVVLHNDDSIYRTTLPPKTLGLQQTQMLYYNPGAKISAVAVHVRHNLIFWSDKRDGAIYRASLDNPSDPQMVVQADANSLAIDWLHDHLYWTENMTIQMSTLDGRLRTIVLGDTDKPLSVAVDPISRYLFWSTCNWRKLFMKASLDGHNRTVLMSTNETCATSLSLDISTRQMFWVDYSRRMASSMTYDGQNRVDVFEPRVHSLALFSDVLLWISRHDQTLYVNSTSFPFEIPLTFEPQGLTVFSSLSQLGGPNYCLDVECQGMCVSGQEQGTSSCLCPRGSYLADNDISCRSIHQPPPTDNQTEDGLQVTGYDSGSVSLTSIIIPDVESYVITIQPVNSYQRRDPSAYKPTTLQTSTFPITIKYLQPATTYSVAVEARPKKLGTRRIEVTTSPPPIQMLRLSSVYKPGDPVPIQWQHHTDYFDLSVSWRPLVRQYFLLMFLPSVKLYNTDEDELEATIQPRALLHKIRHALDRQGVQDKFFVLMHYKNKIMFDRDPEMILNNTPPDTEFFLAMVQVSEYNGSYGIDITMSERTSIPAPSLGK